MLRHLKCPHGPRECLTKEEVVVGVVEGEEEEEEEGVEGEVEEVTFRQGSLLIPKIEFLPDPCVSARHKFSAARHLKLFCTPGNWDSLSVARFMFVADMHGGTW